MLVTQSNGTVKPQTPPSSLQGVAPGVTRSQVAASLAANPGASFAYGVTKSGQAVPGATPMPDTADIVSAYQNAHGGTGGAGGDSGYSDYNADPILLRIQAANQTARENARLAAITAEKQLAIQLGDASGIIDDPTVAAEAAGNPYSTLAGLLKGYGQTKIAHDESLNKANLFYSGTRAKTIADDADQYQQNTVNARNQALGQLATIQQNLAMALGGADQADIQGLTDAEQRAAQRAATYGYDPGGGQTTSATTTPSATAPAAPKVAPLPQPTIRSSLTGGNTGSASAAAQGYTTAGPSQYPLPTIKAASRAVSSLLTPKLGRVI